MPTATPRWLDGQVATPAGDVPRARTTLALVDRLGGWAARWGVGRMDYRVAPGLVAVGHPTADAPVLVSANYKMSFDRLRRVLAGRDAWLLVLDTRGINVWCAAGKGTFGTDELVHRTEVTRLHEVVTHRRLIVPQLGAPGVAAHEVAARSGFRVVYGPVRAEDLPVFLDAGAKATPAMRRVRFGLADRLVLVPMEIVMGLKLALVLASLLLLLGGVGPGLYALARVREVGLPSAAAFLGAYLLAAVLGPVLLPWLPGRSFAVKGAALGAGLVLVAGALARGAGLPVPPLHAGAAALLVPALASFVLLNFTGATTYTSLSGVLKEMRLALPVQGGAAVVGFGLWLAGLFVGRGVGA